MRASGGISNERNSTSPSRPRSAVGRIELVDADFGAMGIAGDVDEQIAENAVDDPERPAGPGDLRERDLELMELVVARLVEPRRLARRADEQAREQIGKRGMALPVEHEAREQIGPAQERRIRGRRAADHDVVAAARAGVTAVGEELVGSEPRQPRLLIKRRRCLDGLPPRRRGMDVDLDDARIGRDLDDVEPAVGRRRIAFHAHRRLPFARDLFDGREQLEIILERLRRRHEHAEDAVARLDSERGAHRHVGVELRLDRRRRGRPEGIV